jgi:small GTP-binding protein
MPKNKDKKDVPQETCHIVVVGCGGTGKTALIHQFMYNKFVETYDPTTADNFRKVVQIEGKNYQVDILDTAGQEDLMRDKYYKSGDAFICVFALNQKLTLTAIDGFRDHIIAVKGTEDIPFLLVGNKSDLEGREIEKSTAEEMAQKFKCSYLETSAKAASNVEEVFLSMVRVVVKAKTEEAETQRVTCSDWCKSKCNIL